MPTGFYPIKFATTSQPPQQVRLSTVALQPSGATALHQAPTTVPIKDVAFQQEILSHIIFNLNKNGPIISSDAVAFYNDRFDPNTKWYFPGFCLQSPLQNSFLFTCWQSGVDKDANSTYSGVATFTLEKSIPAEVAAQIQNNPAFREIPLNNLSFNFVVSLADKTSLSYPCSFVQDQNTFKLIIQLDQQDGLIRFYKFISNQVNANYCSIQISASYFGYTLKPAQVYLPINKQAFFQANFQAFRPAASSWGTTGVNLPARTAPSTTNDTTNYITNDAMPFTRDIVNVNFDCHEFPNNYLTKAADTSTSIFACKPPFGDGSLARNEYNKFHTPGSLAGTGVSAVYVNVYNGNYLVIPEQYQIAIDETDGNTLIPAAYLFTNIDANNISNSVATFRFHIAPTVSGFQLLLLKKLLLQSIPASLNKKLDDIFIEFPTKIHQPELIQFNKDEIPNIEIEVIGAYTHGVEGCNFLSLEFQNVSIGNGNAAFIANMLKLPGGGMTENIVFDVDSDTDPNPQASIVLSLNDNDITGNGLLIHQDNNLVYLINRTLFTISASRLADKNSDPKALDPALAISPNQAVSTNAISDVTEIPFTEFEYSYKVPPDYRDKILNEVRTDAGDVVKDDLIVTNNTGLFALYHIDYIDLLLAIIDPTHPDSQNALPYTNLCSKSVTLAKEKDGAVTFIDFALPVASYLAKWSVVYSTVIHFTDNSVQQNDPRHIDDVNSLGKLINLTVSNLNLQPPRPPTQTTTTP